MTPMPLKSSFRSSSEVVIGSKPCTKMRLLVSRKPACNHPAAAFCSASFTALLFGAPHRYTLRHWKLELPHPSHCQSSEAPACGAF